uniref:Putative salivary kunitz domain protein n=1 Tax=Ixodes ricinus TaxID=34613 RepID=A0A0K8R5S0_IXORI
MKATIAVICVFSAVVLISALSEEACRAPRPLSMCGPGVTVTLQYYFNNNTDKCEAENECGTGPNTFLTEEDCKHECPYGKNATSSLISL